MKKPARPSIQFPTYTNESSATAVDDNPWFAADPAATDDDEETVVRAPRQAAAPAPARTVTKPMAAARASAASAPKAAPSRPTDLGRRVQLPSAPTADIPPPPADLMPKPLTGPTLLSAAPAWTLPPVPKAAAPVPERKEFQSFGPVAFDLDDGRSQPTVVVPRPRRSLVSYLAAALAVIAGLVGGRALVAGGDASPASSPPSSVSSLGAAPAAAGGHRLTPEELFPRAAATMPPRTKLSPAEYQRQKARLAADLAQRNAPVLAPDLVPRSPFARRAAPPNLDEMIRAPRLRGEHD